MNRLGLLIVCYLMVPVCTSLAQDDLEQLEQAPRVIPDSTETDDSELPGRPTREPSSPVLNGSNEFPGNWSLYPFAGNRPWVDYSSPSPPPPLWTFQADALLLQRNQKFGGTLAVREPAQSVILNGDDLDFGFEPGVRLLFGYLNGYGNLEVSYKGFLEWSEVGSVRGNDNVSIPGDLSAAAPDFDSADIIGAEYKSEMQDIEVNQFFSISQEGPVDTSMMDGDHLDMLVGLRVMLLEEEFNLAAANGGERSLYRISTENDLFGGQIGLRWTVRQGAWFFQSQAKVGLYANPNHQEQQVRDLDDALLIRNTRSEHTNASVVPELEFALGYKVTPNVALRAGCLLTWVEGISLAPDQLDFTNTANSGTDLNDTDSFLAYGVTLGLIFTLP